MRRRRRDTWIEAAVVAVSMLSGCSRTDLGPESPDAEAATDGTFDGPGTARDGARDGTRDGTRTDSGTDGVADTQPPPDVSASDGPSDAMTPDAGADVEAEASCAVDAGPLDDAEVALGQSIVAAHRCVRCHGGTFSGNYNGVASPTLEGGIAYPPNLTPDPATGLGCWTDDQIENAFLNGIDNQGTPLCPPMPRFGHLTDGGEIDAGGARAVVAFLRSLPIFVNMVPSTPDCPMPEAGPQDASQDAGPTDAMVDAGD